MYTNTPSQEDHVTCMERINHFVYHELTNTVFIKQDDQEQIQALSDVTSGIQVDERLTNWLEGKGEVDQTRTGYASARALALEWLGPVYGALDEATLQDYAGIIRNAENPDVGADLLQEDLKSQRKVLFLEFYDCIVPIKFIKDIEYENKI